MTKPPKPPAFIDATPEIGEFIQRLAPGSDLRRIIDNARKDLWENMLIGDQEEKRKIPKYYRKKYGTDNLYHLDIEGQRHIMYTIISDARGTGIVVLELFLTHKEYDRRMGYA